jgi:formylglycine-generating enzyme required for sulfatase activity
MYLPHLGLLALLILTGGLLPSSAQSASRSYRDCRDCPELVSIPPGTFTMGASAAEEEHEGVVSGLRGRAQPQHSVTLADGFRLGKYPVTRAEFAAFIADSGYSTNDVCTVYASTGRQLEWKSQRGYSWRNPNYPQTDRDPVVCVGWDDAHAYTAWLSRKTGHDYRLPSEAEWEFAARAGSTTVRFWGDDPQQGCRYANTADQKFVALKRFPGDGALSCSDGYAYTAPVGRFQPNAFGLYDTLGNVWQWTEDCFNSSLEGAPSNGSAWLTGTCAMRVHKGGAWAFVPSFVRSGGRMRDELERHDARGGFRVAMSQ